MRVLILILLLIAADASGQVTPDPAQELWDLYKAGQFSEVVARGQGLLNTGTVSAQVELAVGRALVDLGQSEAGLPYLQRAVDQDPERTWVYAWAQNYLGNAQALLGNLPAARQAYQLARDCGATRNATRTAGRSLRGLGLDAYFDDWNVEKTAHFVFSFSPRLGIFDRQDFVAEREEAFAAISDWFGGKPDRKIRFFVWSDHVEAELAGLPPLGFSRPEFYLIHAHVGQTRGHEITHVISHHATSPGTKTGLINEGISVVHDQTGRNRMETARQAIDMGTRGLGDSPYVPVELRALWEDFDLLDTTFSYPIAAAFVDHLLARGGKESFLAFFPDQTYTHAQAIYGTALETWIDEFEADLLGRN
jgi:tetratricopeptide (TPR) repeat protein